MASRTRERTHGLLVLLLMAPLMLAAAAAVAQDPVRAAEPRVAPLSDPMLALLRQLQQPPERAQLRVPQLPAQVVRGQYVHNILVNDPDRDTPELTTQNETSVAVNGRTVCAGYNDIHAPFPDSSSGFARSGDGGRSWVATGQTAPQGRRGDPVVAVDQRSGAFYYAGLLLLGSRAADDGVTSVIEVRRSRDDCASFASGAVASVSAAVPSACWAPLANQCKACRRNADCDSRPGSADGVCGGPDVDDKPWMAVDNGGGAAAGNICVCWARFLDVNTTVPNEGELHFTRSVDGGLSFEPEQIISAPGDDFPTGCQLAVGPAGEVNAAWTAQSGDDVVIRFRRSLDGGISWDPPLPQPGALVSAPRFRPAGVDHVAACGQTAVCGQRVDVRRTALNGSIRVNSFPSLGVDATTGPFRGTLYVAWDQDPSRAQDNSDVVVSRSADGGHTWSEPQQIGGGTATDQFFPTLAVGPGGAVSVAWYDRRNDPQNLLLDVYASVSRDGGVAFGPLRRLTDASFAVPPLAGQPTSTGNFNPQTSACYMGDYIGSAADATSFFYAWGDNRNTVVSASYPGGRPDPDIVFDRWLACVGDCNGSGDVTVDELVVGVNLALEAQAIETCKPFDANGDERVSVDELVSAVNGDLAGCL